MMLSFMYAELYSFVQAAADNSIKFQDTLPYAVVMAFGGVFTYAIKSFIDRRSISAVAKKEEATAADVIAGAAAELINPLRAELSTTRAEVVELRTALATNTKEMHQLTAALEVQNERNSDLEARNTELERENSELQESCRHNDELKARNIELERENAELQERVNPGKS